MSVSQQRSSTKQITSHFEGYLGGIQDQEIPTKFPAHKRQIDFGQSPAANNEFRLCKMNIERCEPHAKAATERYSLKIAVPKFFKYKERFLITLQNL